jgi:hypothetical protein
MKGASFCLFLLGLLGGCNPIGMRADAYSHIRDRMIVRLGLTSFGVYPCTERRPQGDIIGSLPTDECYRMTKPIRWQGLWRNDFEGSRFCPFPAKQCAFGTPGERIWLSMRAGSVTMKNERFGGLYEVDFVGRRTAVKGLHGHMGGSDHELIVDRLISMKQVEAPEE